MPDNKQTVSMKLQDEGKQAALPRTLSVRELADVFGMSVSAIYEAAQQDRLPVPAIKAGRTWRFSLAAVEALLDPARNREVAPDA